ncbi:hypothetical protein SBY92_002542 [Candida maltosa Xu316]
MQGSYNNNGLPRPYYMKPNKKKSSPYSNLKEPIVFFNTPRRKLFGYITMFMLIGTLMWWISQDIKGRPDPEYELVKPEKGGNKNIQIEDKNNANLDKIVNAVGSKADKESLNLDLAENLAEGSKGQKGIGVVEAPKGGIANEAPVVGNDEDELVGTGRGNANKKGYKASIGKTDKAVGGGAAVAAAGGVGNGAEKGISIPDAEDVAAANEISNKDKVQKIIDDTV